MRKTHLRLVELPPAESAHSQDADDWGTTAKGLMKDFGIQRAEEIKLARRRLVGEQFASDVRSLAHGCGIAFEVFVTGVAIAIGRPDYVSVIPLRLRHQSHNKHNNVRDNLTTAVYLYERKYPRKE
jgi:hypothetical protein